MDKNKKPIKHSSGGIPFGLEVLLFVLVIFIIWVFMGGAKKPKEEKPFITPLSDQINPGIKYGPGENNYRQNLETQYGPNNY